MTVRALAVGFAHNAGGQMANRLSKTVLGMKTRARTFALGCGIACAVLGASGCVLGNNSDPPVLSVDLLWDESTSSHFSEGTCESADVVWMEWALKDEDGHTVRKSEKGGNEDCQPGFDFFDLDAGNYSITVTGYDTDDQPLWSSKCTDLLLERFDSLYECRVDQTVP